MGTSPILQHGRQILAFHMFVSLCTPYCSKFLCFVDRAS